VPTNFVRRTVSTEELMALSSPVRATRDGTLTHRGETIKLGDLTMERWEQIQREAREDCCAEAARLAGEQWDRKHAALRRQIDQIVATNQLMLGEDETDGAE
jgi:hypothetical protein